MAFRIKIAYRSKEKEEKEERKEKEENTRDRSLFLADFIKNWVHVIEKITFFAQKRPNLARNWHL